MTANPRNSFDGSSSCWETKSPLWTRLSCKSYSSNDYRLMSDKLAHLADKIVEMAAPHVATSSTSSTPNPEIQQLRSEISEFKRIVQSIHQPRIRHRSSSRPSRPPSPATPDNHSPDASLCWYHPTFWRNSPKMPKSML